MKKIIATFSLLLTIGLQQTALAESSLKIDSSYKNRECKLAQLNRQTKPESPDKAVNFKKPTSTMKVEGGTAELLPPEKSGLPLKTLPGVKTISLKEYRKLKSVPKTGLYLVDTKFVPVSLPEELEKRRYTLKRDGTLLNEEKKPITAFIKSEMYRVKSKNISEAGVKSIKSSTGKLQAQNSFRWTHSRWSMWRVYVWWSCRTIAWTTASAHTGRWGSLRLLPIDEIKTYVRVNGRSDYDSCSNCSLQFSVISDKRCGAWRSHGYHYAYWRLGNYSMWRNRSW